VVVAIFPFRGAFGFAGVEAGGIDLVAVAILPLGFGPAFVAVAVAVFAPVGFVGMDGSSRDSDSSPGTGGLLPD
jgi:hypothetical protein